MLRHVSIALLIAFGCASAPAQNGLRMSGTAQPSGSFLQRRPVFLFPQDDVRSLVLVELRSTTRHGAMGLGGIRFSMAAGLISRPTPTTIPTYPRRLQSRLDP